MYSIPSSFGVNANQSSNGNQRQIPHLNKNYNSLLLIEFKNKLKHKLCFKIFSLLIFAQTFFDKQDKYKNHVHQNFSTSNSPGTVKTQAS